MRAPQRDAAIVAPEALHWGFLTRRSIAPQEDLNLATLKKLRRAFENLPFAIGPDFTFTGEGLWHQQAAGVGSEAGGLSRQAPHLAARLLLALFPARAERIPLA